MLNFIGATIVAGALWWSGKSGLSIGNISFPVISTAQAVCVAAAIYVSTGGYYTLYLMYKTLPRDFRGAVKFIRLKRRLYNFQRKNMTVPKIFNQNVAKNPNKVALIFEDKEWTFAQIDEFSNRVANYLLTLGFRRQEALSLFMENRPEYVATWLGCAKIGVIPALINSNLRQVPLIHSIKAADSKIVICGAELQKAISDVYSELNEMPILVGGLKGEKLVRPEFIDFDMKLSNALPTPVAQIDEGHFVEKLLYIYTSGTTGLPKAAIINNARYFTFATGVNTMCDINEEIIYNPLPLYHTAGGLIGIGQVLVFNCTSVIRKKFSVSNFWPEAKKYNCTVAQYVGEICRYLLSSPPRPVDTQHKVRVMFGNGVRPQIYEEFIRRFQMPWIAEFYGATEGIANTINLDGKPGACGFLSVVLPEIYPAKLIRVDPVTGVPIRDKNGLCIRCEPNEPGEFVAKIVKKDPIGNFEGYADKKATEKKIIRGVFKKGDYAFASGDLMVMDPLGYMFFVDRLGDTFRWRGENVSTTEVEGVVSRISKHKDAVAFGVQVPHTEGRAGMAAIVDPEKEVDMAEFSSIIKEHLPSYAQPLFIRILREIDTTGTFKLKKISLQKEGFDPTKITDDLYFLDPRKKCYVPLTSDIYKNICDGSAGL